MKILSKIILISLSTLLLIGIPTDSIYSQDGDDPIPIPAFPEQELRFQHLTTDDGLSEGRVWGIIQDRQGFMWFTTWDGLNRYDGYEFKVYKEEFGNPNSPGGEGFWEVYEDREGMIWAGSHTGGGLSRFDPTTEQWRRYQHDPDDPHSISSNNVYDILEDRDGVLWVGTEGGGLNRFEGEDEGGEARFTRYPTDPENVSGTSSDLVVAIYEDRSGALWFDTWVGLNRYDRETETFIRYQHNPNDPTSLSDNRVSTTYEDRYGMLWVGTYGGGLNRLDQGTETFTHFRHEPDDPDSISGDTIISIIEDKSGTLWIGTFDGGLNRYDRDTDTFVSYQHDPSDARSLGNNSVTALFVDQSGILWIGTAGGGVDRLDPFGQAFGLTRHKPTDNNSLSNNDVRSVLEDQAGDLWFGTWDGGLNQYNPEMETFTHYLHDPDDPSSLGDTNVLSLLEDREGVLWIGLDNGGLNRLNRGTEDGESAHFVRYTHDIADPQSLGGNGVTALYEDRAGILWVGTWYAGLNALDRHPDDGQVHFKRYQYDPEDSTSIGQGIVWAIHEDPAGVLWVGTAGGGLCRFDRESETFACYVHEQDDDHSLSSNTVWAIHPDQDGSLWLGTSAGLNRFSPQTGQFTHYNTADGLPHDTVVGILEDDASPGNGLGDLWLSTLGGLARFDPQLGTFRNYDASDGLQGDTFNPAVYQTSKGMILFGGQNGLTSFYPQDIQENPSIPPVRVTGFALSNEPVFIGDDSPLQRSIVETEQLALSYEDRVISFEFAALNYSSPGKNRYRYKLEGFDEEWIEVGSDRRFVTYTNLDPGEYVFRVLGSNSDGAWNNVGASINITIPPPWWGTWWFRGGLLLLVIGLIATGFVWQSDRSGRRERELEAQVAERTHEVRERMKELDCLYGISEIASKQGISIEEVLAGTLILLPPAFQFPEIACARIVLDGQEFKTDDYKKTQSSLHAAIVVFEEQVGEVEVSYLEEKSEEDGGLFQEDEKLLLNSVALQLGGIAERLRAQDELRKHEARFRAQYEGIPIPTYTWQKRGDDIVLVDYNEAAAAITQGKVSEFVGHTAGEMYPHRPDIQEDLARCVDEQCSVEREIVYEFMSTGDTRNLALKYGFVAPDMALVHTEDITERVRAQEEATYERDLMHTLLTHTPDYIFFKDKERRFVRASNSFGDLFNRDLEEILGKRDEDLFPPEIAEETVKDDQRVIETGMPLIGKEEGGETIGGAPTWVLTTKLPWYGKDGEIEGLFGISTDITSRKLIERQLRVSETNYRHLVENINEVIYATDVEGLVTYVSPAIESIIGLSPEDIVGELFSKFIVPDDLDRVTDNVEEILSGKTLGTTEYQLTTASGEIRWIRVSSQLSKEGDQITGLQGVVIDITELKRVEEELEKMAVLAERQRLAREIHDSLTQTLYSINLFSNATRQALLTGKDDEVSEHARQIQELSQDALADMRLLIFELQPPIIEETGLANAVRRRLELVESRAGYNTNIRVISERPLPTLVESNLYAIAVESLNNTLKHAEAEQISVVINYGEKLVSITIMDDGKGFELDSSDETWGFGLRSIEERVESINGILSIESSLGEGTTVGVEVPL